MKLFIAALVIANIILIYLVCATGHYFEVRAPSLYDY